MLASEESMRAATVISTALLASLLSISRAYAQNLTPADVEQRVRAGVQAWNANDPIKIIESGFGFRLGNGFGYRTREPRPPDTREAALTSIRTVFAFTIPGENSPSR
jgi:hypothetical protein